MHQRDFVASVAYQNKRLRSEIDELNSGKRKVYLDGEDISSSEADKLQHRFVENITIIRRVSNKP